jgi:hypothetical protein
MDDRAHPFRGAVGFSVKSGWSAAVLLIGAPGSPRLVDSRRVELTAPAIPESRQPYHAGFATARASGPELSRLLRLVRQFGDRSVSGVIREYGSRAQLVGAGVVVGSLIDPETITNEHIRIHALEGRLFRGVVEQAARRNGLTCSIWRERDIYALAAETLRHSDEHLRRAVQAMGKSVTGSWRAEQKLAALAAWLVLAGCVRRTRSLPVDLALASGKEKRQPGAGVTHASRDRRRGFK